MNFKKKKLVEFGENSLIARTKWRSWIYGDRDRDFAWTAQKVMPGNDF